MTLLRLLNAQGVAGIALSLALGILLLIQKGETRHWKNESSRFERLYIQQQSALAGTVANYRAAARQAEAADRANATRVASEQSAINERTSNDYQARIAAARSLAQRLRAQDPAAAADSGDCAAAAMPRLSAPADDAAQAAGQDRLPDPDALTATEQAIQLDELIKWVKAQATVDPNEEQE